MFSSVGAGALSKAWAPLMGAVKQAPYRYMEQLRQIEGCHPRPPRKLSPDLADIKTPLKPGAWREALQGHPDAEFAQYIVHGIEKGFHIGFNHELCSCRPASNNLISASQHPAVVEEYLGKELREGRMAEVTDPAGLIGLQISPFGVIPKKDPGKWRLIVDLSFPEGASVNDGIDKSVCSLEYVTVDHIAAGVRALGEGAMLAKVDVRSAYRIVPVHPDDRPLLGVRWGERVFVDKALPFGLRSAPIIFTALADAIEWITRQRGASLLTHYLDDFTVLGKAGSPECAESLSLLHGICEDLGVPIAPDKCEGPATCMTILGIEIDSISQEVRLPINKLGRLKQTIRQWRGRKACTLRELQSLIGQLNHACKVVRPGRVFLSRMFRLAASARRPSHRVRLNREFRSDLEWWHSFLESWNGVSLCWLFDPKHPGVVITSDASGSWGCGAYLGQGDRWLQYQWQGDTLAANITLKELLPIVMACALWGRDWSGSTVLARCDNEAVVAVINGGYSREPDMMHLLRCLIFFSGYFQFQLYASHIPGRHNELADALSRDNLHLFQERSEAALGARPTPIPQELEELLMTLKPDWLSHDWRSRFTSICAAR